MYVQTCKFTMILRKTGKHKLICHLWRMLGPTFFFLISVPRPGIEPRSWQQKPGIPTTRPPENSLGAASQFENCQIKRKESSMYPFWYEPYFTGTKWLIRRGLFIDIFQLTKKNRISRPPFSTSNGSRQRSSMVANIMKGDNHKLCAFKQKQEASTRKQSYTHTHTHTKQT